MQLQLEGKVALVTGGARGIGQAIALTLAREGVHVAICGRDRDSLEATRAEIAAMGVRSTAIVADLLVARDCERAVDEAADTLGRLDILINNASTNVDSQPRALEAVSDDELLERVMIKGVASVRCSRAALKHLRRAGGGAIILLGGTSGRVVSEAGGGYASGLGNSFVAYFSKRLSAEVARDRITVNVLHPGTTRTDRNPPRLEAVAARLGISYDEAEGRQAAGIPIGRMVDPVDVASMAVFLASPLASAITGQVIAIDGGVTPTVVY